MTKLKIGALPDDKPVKLTIGLPAQVHRDLIAYAEILAAESGQVHDPSKLIGPMLARFMATDRGFLRARKKRQRPDDQSVTTGRLLGMIEAS